MRRPETCQTRINLDAKRSRALAGRRPGRTFPAMHSDHDPAAVRRGILRGAGSLLVHVALHGFGYTRSRHQPRRARDLRTLVFVHGFGANRAVFFPLQGYLRLKGLGRQYSYNYRSAGSIEGLAVQLKQRLTEQIKGGRIDLICHSLGGLVARYYLQALGGARRVDHMVTLATPHAGTHASVYVPTAVASQLRPGGPFLRHLDALPPPEGVVCHSFVAEEDHVVLPPEAGMAPFGEHRVFARAGHNDLLLAPRVWAAIHEVLAGG